MERKCRQDTEENEALLEHEDVQDDEQPDDWWDDALYVEDSDDSEYLYLLIQPPNLVEMFNFSNVNVPYS